MNQANYGSLEACQRLVEAGIVLETEVYWAKTMFGEMHLYHLEGLHNLVKGDPIPAPSMAEVWRELPQNHYTTTTQPELHLNMTKTHIGYIGGKGDGFMLPYTNPTDALIDLLIWLRKEKK